MIFREATLSDIPQLQMVRNAVKENVLSNPALITAAHYEEYLTLRGKGWVCEIDGQIVGFAIVDLKDHNVWALFLHTDYEAKGIGKQLHKLMLDWYFQQTSVTLWLGTAFHTRAETFYRQQGWTEIGLHGTDEIKFEMTAADWKTKKQGSTMLK
jgi:GNAT superfamily N-acetyltransferase